MKPIILTFPIYRVFKKIDKKTSKRKDIPVLMGLNWYRNCHYMTLNTVKQEYKNMTLEQLKSISDTFDTIRVEYHVYVQKKGTDGSNIRSVLEKFVLDGIVSAGIIKDDNIDFLSSDSSFYYYDKEYPRFEIHIFGNKVDKKY